ncbi:hypothetical protein [Paraburkholderia unamae]|uniref:Uncharacterized protein n=1 Tax=Paraburkholderia unamae TaxID=219649 RepID=A0ACC6RJT1_9BURK
MLERLGYDLPTGKSAAPFLTIRIARAFRVLDVQDVIRLCAEPPA